MSASRGMHVSTLIGGAAVTLALIALVALAAERVARTHTAELRAERGWTMTPAETTAARAAQIERLSHYAWIDRKKNVTALPIERAMALVAAEDAAQREGAPR